MKFRIVFIAPWTSFQQNFLVVAPTAAAAEKALRKESPCCHIAEIMELEPETRGIFAEVNSSGDRI